MEMLEEIVATDDKQRYSFNDDHTLIRANQGHSIHVDVELQQVIPSEYFWHGTAQKHVASIQESGLIPKSRLYVHLSDNRDTAANVGARHGALILYRVQAGQMCRDGFTFYLSANGVWLTKHVPVTFLENV